MKSQAKIFRSIALAVMLVFAVVACNNPSGPDNGPISGGNGNGDPNGDLRPPMPPGVSPPTDWDGNEWPEYPFPWSPPSGWNPGGEWPADTRPEFPGAGGVSPPVGWEPGHPWPEYPFQYSPPDGWNPGAPWPYLPGDGNGGNGDLRPPMPPGVSPPPGWETGHPWPEYPFQWSPPPGWSPGGEWPADTRPEFPGAGGVSPPPGWEPGHPWPEYPFQYSPPDGWNPGAPWPYLPGDGDAIEPGVPPTLQAGLFAGAPGSLTAASIRIPSVAQNDVAAAVSYVNNYAGTRTFTLLLTADSYVDGQQTLNEVGANLTIIGLGGVRTIQRSNDGNLFTVNGTGRSLTIGANITLYGRPSPAAANAGNTVVTVEQGANLVMLDGSRITRNHNAWNVLSSGWGSTVFINNTASAFFMYGGTITGNTSASASGAVLVDTSATFTMSGGTITGNSSTNFGSDAVGGVRVAGGGVFAMQGGSVSGNNGWAGDVFIMPTSSISLIGGATIETLTIGIADNFSTPFITIGSGWIGNITGELNLRSNVTSLDTTIGWWEGMPVLSGPGFNAGVVERFPLGDFMGLGASGANRRPIADTHVINNEGRVAVR